MKVFFFILTFLIAFILIFYNFPNIPQNLDKDEVEFAKLALSLKDQPYIVYSPLATGHPTLYFYILLASLELFGISNFSLRFPSALFGVINPLIFFLIANKIFIVLKIKNHLFFSFLASILLVTSRWYFNFARFSYEVTFLLFLELIAILSIIYWLNKKNNIFLVISGVFSGLAFNSYTPGRIFFILPLFMIILTHFKKIKKNTSPENKIRVLKDLALFLLPFILLTIPLILYFLNNPDIRINQQFFLSNPEINLKEKLFFLTKNLYANISMLFQKGDVNGRHNYPEKPALNPIFFFFFLIGFLSSLIKYRYINLISSIYFLISILPTVLTYPWENPNMLRTYTLLPSISLWTTIGINSCYQFLKSSFKNSFLGLLIFMLIIISSFYEIRTYFKYQTLVFKEAFEIKEKLEEKIKYEQ